VRNIDFASKQSELLKKIGDFDYESLIEELGQARNEVGRVCKTYKQAIKELEVNVPSVLIQQKDIDELFQKPVSILEIMKERLGIDFSLQKKQAD